MTDIDFFNQDKQAEASATVSAETAEYVRQTAAAIARDNPNDPRMQEHAALLLSQLEGLAPPIPTDSRTVQQVRHDKAFGVAFAPDGKPALPSDLNAVIQRDAAAVAPDHAKVAAQLKAVGLDAEKVIGAAQNVARQDRLAGQGREPERL
jgi:hypothetical protein